MSIAEKLVKIAENEQKVYNAGYEKGKSEGGGDSYYDTFWDSFQTGGTRTNYQRGFSGKGWKDETFNPKYQIIPTASYAQYMFHESALTKPDLSKVDFSKAASVLQLFMSSTVEELGVLNFSSVLKGYNGINQTFIYCANLKKIEKIILPNDAIKVNGFSSCTSLEEIRFEGTIYAEPNFQWSPLSVESMKNIISCLNNYSGTSEEFTQRLVFNDECWAALEADSTAPDGKTWREYVQILGWNT